MVYSDVDGRYRGLDGNIFTADGFTNYTIFSLWDTYRAQHPLLTILQPERSRDMMRSLLAHRRAERARRAAGVVAPRQRELVHDRLPRGLGDRRRLPQGAAVDSTPTRPSRR